MCRVLADCCQGLGLGFRVLGFRVWGLGFDGGSVRVFIRVVTGSGLRALLVFSVEGLGLYASEAGGCRAIEISIQVGIKA